MRVKSKEIELAYDEIGTGPAVLLIHGFPLNRQMWQPQLNAVAQAGFRAIAFDLPGFGESELPSATPTIDSFADYTVGLMEALGIEKAAIAGMSMGGYILQNLLERYPQRIAAACFIATKSAADDEAGKARRTALATEAERLGSNPITKLFAELLFAPDTVETNPHLVAQVISWMRATDPKAVAGGLLAMRDRKDYTPLLPGFQQPTAFIGGAEDRAGSPHSGEVFQKGLPDCLGITVIEKAGHMVNMERPDVFNRALIAFLHGANLV
ncbi:alpha/beta fold hydrolase [Geomesophilobacter sediminis]|uniref:Alpha/beta hydrolase n=1 Tax=Geomesophilobacter sediminis TaxID=2798584 RepID=A0A8J7M0R9_9BACT|nr:alpha/beta hydrolase [Geomesophilobacter sediminis]MBJ6726498.1 alpha/beta hydrolase [Geomesophilobacter sediminis]